MIDYNLLNYLEERNITRQLDKKTKYCHIQSKITIRYEQYNERFSPNTFENILRKTIPPVNTITVRWDFVSENLVEYRIRMPVEVFPFFMDVIYEIREGDYPFRIEDENLLYTYSWERRYEQ